MIFDTANNIRDYLLGVSISEREEFEKRLMADKEFSNEVSIVEEELIQDYVDGNLDDSEKKSFETHFLVSKERTEKVKFAKALRKLVDSKTSSDLTEKPEPTPTPKTTEKPQSIFDWLFGNPIPAVVGLLVIAAIGSFAVWNGFFQESDSEVALASLNKAFEKERPLESRISGFDYAPKRNTRGNDDSKINKIELDRAEILILKNASENPNAENLHALGRLYLSKREFDNAIEQLEKAEKLDSENAPIQNDLGVAYLEKAEVLGEDDGKSEEFSRKSLKRFEKAMKLNPKLPEAQFNKSVILEALKQPEKAVNAWEHYLLLDPNSRWYEEAKKNLENLSY